MGDGIDHASLLSVQRVDGHGGGRCRPRAAAGRAQAIDHVLEVGVDAVSLPAKFGRRGWRAEARRGGVLERVQAHDDMPWRHGRGADWGAWRFCMSTVGTTGFSGQRGEGWTRWVEEGVVGWSWPWWRWQCATAWPWGMHKARCREVRGVQHDSE